MAKHMLDAYTESLIEMIENSENGINVNDLREFTERYKAESIGADSVSLRAHHQNCLTRCEQEVFDPASKREPFKRLITSRFVGLFPPTGGFDDSGRYVSRRMLPGLFLALEKMAGNDALQKGHTLCKALIDDMKRSEQGFYWEDLYTNSQAQAAVDDLLMAIVPHFTNPMKRVSWLVGLINSDLAPAEQYDFEGSANEHWHVDEHGIIYVLRSVFAPLKRQLLDKEHAKVLANTYGVEKTRILHALVTTLDKAEV